MTAVATRRDLSLRAPIAASALLHAAAVAAFFFVRQSDRAPSPPTYRVNLIAAAAGPRAIGVVQPTPAPVDQPPAPAPVARKVDPVRMKAPAKAPPEARAAKIATPNAVPAAPPKPNTPAPVAGGGPEGGKGADVANVTIDNGIAFPYPAYLEKIVRMIALNFKPSNRGALQAEVAFMIRRDGTIAGLRLTKRSAVFSFDQDALAAVELASRSFGPLPQGFTDDVLPVIFSFDPRLIR
ncbi:MAG: TonB protein [Gemmatimonadetes bacterium]|nr:TonB protein [Gemmatimonadota bacterium]